MKLRTILVFIFCAIAASAQTGPVLPVMGSPWSGNSAITLDASCSNHGTTNLLICSSAMTVTAGDTITCNVTGVSGGNRITGTVVDSVNGFYKNVYGIVHPASTDSFVTTAVIENSASGSITPTLFFSNTPNTQGTLNCYAWKSTATSNVLDGGAVEQTQNATSTNPTSGTAAAPTNNNEAVVAFMSRSSSTAPSSGGGAWLPSGTLTLVGSSSVRQASEYQIQTSAVAVNGPFTATGSVAYVDSQLAVLPLGQTGGYRSLSGIFVPLGAPGSAPTGTVTTTTMGGATSTLGSTNFYNSPIWTQGGATAPTYDTSVNPTGTRGIMVQGVAHTFGDAGSSVLYAGATAANNYYNMKDIWTNYGNQRWVSFFYRLASSGVSNGQECDIMDVSGGVTDSDMTVQSQYATGNGLGFVIEPTNTGGSQSGSSQLMGSLSLDTDYWVQFGLAGVNERYHTLAVYSKSGATWSPVPGSPFTYDHLCTNATHALCTTPAATATQTGTASSGSTTLTLGSGTGTVNGQIVLDPTNNCIPWPTTADSGGGTTTITLSQKTTCGISGTSVKFYAVPFGIATATNGTVSAGSTALTVVVPNTGTIATGQSVGGSGILEGTTVSAVSGTSVTLSLPANAAMTNGGVSFWTASANTNVFQFGKYSSCSMASNQWWSNIIDDTFGTWGMFAPN